MSEPMLSFQTWICPICCDDHTANTLNQAFCKTSDLQNMANEIEQLKSKLKVAVDVLDTIAFDGSSRENCTRIATKALEEIGEIK